MGILDFLQSPRAISAAQNLAAAATSWSDPVRGAALFEQAQEASKIARFREAVSEMGANPDDVTSWGPDHIALGIKLGVISPKEGISLGLALRQMSEDLAHRKWEREEKWPKELGLEERRIGATEQHYRDWADIERQKLKIMALGTMLRAAGVGRGSSDRERLPEGFKDLLNEQPFKASRSTEEPEANAANAAFRDGMTRFVSEFYQRNGRVPNFAELAAYRNALVDQITVATAARALPGVLEREKKLPLIDGELHVNVLGRTARFSKSDVEKLLSSLRPPQEASQPSLRAPSYDAAAETIQTLVGGGSEYTGKSLLEELLDRFGGRARARELSPEDEAVLEALQGRPTGGPPPPPPKPATTRQLSPADEAVLEALQGFRTTPTPRTPIAEMLGQAGERFAQQAERIGDMVARGGSRAGEQLIRGIETAKELPGKVAQAVQQLPEMALQGVDRLGTRIGQGAERLGARFGQEAERIGTEFAARAEQTPQMVVEALTKLRDRGFEPLEPSDFERPSSVEEINKLIEEAAASAKKIPIEELWQAAKEGFELGDAMAGRVPSRTFEGLLDLGRRAKEDLQWLDEFYGNVPSRIWTKVQLSPEAKASVERLISLMHHLNTEELPRATVQDIGEDIRKSVASLRKTLGFEDSETLLQYIYQGLSNAREMTGGVFPPKGLIDSLAEGRW